MRSITIDEKSVFAICAGQLDIDSFCAELSLPASTATSKCVTVGDHGFVLSRVFQPNDALLTISLTDDGPLSEMSTESREEAFGRLIRCTSRVITGRTRSIPSKWRPFHVKSLLSFQADRYLSSVDGGKTNAGRIILEHTHSTGTRVFAFLLDREGVRDLALVTPPRDLMQSAIESIPTALALPEEIVANGGLGNAVNLDNQLPTTINGLFTTEEWYEARLTLAQRKFVDHPLSTSVRLVGPAGTGKTVALVVKCIKELKKSISENSNKRFLFLTHATDTASTVEDLIQTMEPESGIEFLASENPQITVTTLYGVADEQMRYDLAGIRPFSIDGHEGRAFQAEILNEAIDDYKQGNWIIYQNSCSEPFRTYMLSPSDSMERRFFLWEILNEFACVLDAEGIRSSNARREQYVTEKRKSWMLQLTTKEEREIILDLYDIFRAKLRENKAIGGDQMVTDYLNHLDSFKWEATREAQGYDAIFVDELHLFNRQERMVFRHLLKSSDETPIVFMAYDAKQSPRDTFLNLPSVEAKHLDLWKDAKLGKVEKIELIDVFRYTPQITKALSCIDEQFPGQNLDDDWPQYTGISQIEDGPTPTICSVESINAMYSIVFKRAKGTQKTLGKAGRVAILCASNELFLKYLEFTAYRNDFVAITSRDDASGITKSVKKFIFSMPEYVAGLQFDTVYLIDVNKDEIPDGPYSTAATRKFIAQIYLGASRAERVLELYSSEEHEGISSTVSRAVLANAITTVLQADLI